MFFMPGTVGRGHLQPDTEEDTAGVLCNAPGARNSVPKKSRPPITGIEKPDELQRDVHELCLYNAAARKAAKKS